MDKKKVQLSLAGGGARGAVLLALVEEFEKEGYEITKISGSSVGSIIAMTYAYTLSSRRTIRLLINLLDELNSYDIFNKSKAQVVADALFAEEDGMMSCLLLYKLFSDFTERIGLNSLDDLKIPYAATATELNLAKTIVFSNAPSEFAEESSEFSYFDSEIEPSAVLTASSCFPVILSSFQYKEHKFIDGGTMMNVPATLHKKEADNPSVALYYDFLEPIKAESLDSPKDTAFRALDLMSNAADEEEALKADYKIKMPVKIESAEFKHGERSLAHAKRYIKAKGGLKNLLVKN